MLNVTLCFVCTAVIWLFENLPNTEARAQRVRGHSLSHLLQRYTVSHATVIKGHVPVGCFLILTRCEVACTFSLCFEDN